MVGLTAAWTRALGMSTARWLEIPARPVPTALLTPTQAVTDDLWPAARPNPVSCADRAVHAVQLGRAVYIEDGHHKWARARRDGHAAVLTRVLVIPGFAIPQQRNHRAEVPA